MTAEVRTRFAPSPTGELHTGSVRTALIGWLFAAHSGGSFVLRIDDTDLVRSTTASEEAIYDGLRWLGLDWAEGPDIGGPYGPYRQSERAGLYAAHARTLLDSGAAYHCRCTRERLAALAREQAAAGRPPRYDGRCRAQKAAPPVDTPPEDTTAEDTTQVIRFHVPEDTVVEFDDIVHGPLRFDARAMGDFIITASDGGPSYNFASAVDDALMRITHVTRGDDHISNTPRQILLMRALGFELPAWCHLPLVLAPDRTPLGKRHGGSTIRGLREAGYLPEAVVAGLARLGYFAGTDGGDGAGLITLDELARGFDARRLSKSPSVFDADSLKSVNRDSIRRATTERLAGLMPELARECGADMLARAVDAVKGTAGDLAELSALARPLAGTLTLGPEATERLSEYGAENILKALLAEAEKTDVLDEGAFATAVKAAGAAAGAKGRALYMPVRLALTGEEHGIELAEVARLLGRDEVVKRLKLALAASAAQ